MQLEIKELDKAQEFNPESKEIVRSNSFINGRYKFSLMQTKILLLLSSQVRKGDEPGKLYTLPLSAMLENTRNTKAVVDNAKALQLTTVEIPAFNQKGKQYISSITLLTKVVYPKDYSGNIYIEIHSDLKPHFLDLKERYSKYLLDYVWDFKYEHSIRVYEMLKEYWNISKKSRYFDQSEFKQKLGISESYKRKNAKGETVDNFKDLRINVLEKAQQDFKRCADIYFEVEPKKKGRVVIGFTLHIESRLSDQGEKQLSGDPGKKAVDPALVAQLEKEHDPLLVRFLVGRAQNNPGIKNPSGWVRKALKEGFLNDEFEDHKRKLEQVQQNKQHSLQQQEKEKQAEAIRKEYNEFWQQRCLEYFSRFEHQLDAYTEGFRKQYGHDPKTRTILQELATGKPGQLAKQRIGSFILQQEGTPEEKDIKIFALNRFQVALDD